MATADGHVDVVLWDFGDTLADERWCWACPVGVPGWTDAWRECAATELFVRWGRGDASIDAVAAHLSDATGMSPRAVRRHLDARFRDIVFHARTWAIARAGEHRQAIVTVNPVEFRDIVASYSLDRVFELIVISGEEHTDSKTDLCDRALHHLGVGGRDRALLIDNIEANVTSWRDLGGLAYWYRGDDPFADDMSERGWAGLVPPPA